MHSLRPLLYEPGHHGGLQEVFIMVGPVEDPFTGSPKNSSPGGCRREWSINMVALTGVQRVMWVQFRIRSRAPQDIVAQGTV